MNSFTILQMEKVHPFLKTILETIEPFGVWSMIMEITAVTVIAGLSYLRAISIVLSYWIVSLTVTYLFGLRIGYFS